MKITGKHGMASLGGFLAAAALVVVGAQARRRQVVAS